MKTTKITALFFAMLSVAWMQVQAQRIKVTSVPEMGTYGQILGVIEGVTNPADYKITCLIDINDSLNSRPQSSKPITPVETDGTFAVNFLSGGLDELSTMVHLYLIPVGIEVPVINQSTNVPPEIRNISVANVSIDRTSSKEEFIWCGTAWKIKDTADFVPVNPGPNFYSRQNVWVDNSNRLHLKVAYTNGAWHCAEIVSTNSFGYGEYHFTMDNEISSYPGEIVFSIRVYDLEPDQYHKEMGFLFSNNKDFIGGSSAFKWKRFVEPKNVTSPKHSSISSWGSYIKQTLVWTPIGVSFPAVTIDSPPGHIYFNPKYVIERTENGVTKEFGETLIYTGYTVHLTNYVWSTSQKAVTFRARATGISTPFYMDGGTEARWDSNLKVIPSNEKVRLGIWLIDGNAPDADPSTEFEIIIKDFHFIPLDMKYIQPTLKVRREYPMEIIDLYIPRSW